MSDGRLADLRCFPTAKPNNSQRSLVCGTVSLYSKLTFLHTSDLLWRHGKFISSVQNTTMIFRQYFVQREINFYSSIAECCVLFFLKKIRAFRSRQIRSLSISQWFPRNNGELVRTMVDISQDGLERMCLLLMKSAMFVSCMSDYALIRSA